MLPQARRMCSSCLRFMREPPGDLPALPRRKDPAERAALAEAPPLLPRIKQEGTDLIPLQLQDAAPFHNRRRRALKAPPPARLPGSLEAGPGGIPVDGIRNGPRKREAPPIYLFMGLHGAKCSTPGNGDQKRERERRGRSSQLSLFTL